MAPKQIPALPLLPPNEIDSLADEIVVHDASSGSAKRVSVSSIKAAGGQVDFAPGVYIEFDTDRFNFYIDGVLVGTIGG